MKITVEVFYRSTSNTSSRHERFSIMSNCSRKGWQLNFVNIAHVDLATEAGLSVKRRRLLMFFFVADISIMHYNQLR